MAVTTVARLGNGLDKLMQAYEILGTQDGACSAKVNRWVSIISRRRSCRAESQIKVTR